MKERPKIFNRNMIYATLAGFKTQFREVMRHQPIGAWAKPPLECIDGRFTSNGCKSDIKCPFGQRGDRLWVRETWIVHPDYNGVVPRNIRKRSRETNSEGDINTCILLNHRAGNYDPWPAEPNHGPWGTSDNEWRSPVSMPRWASRLVLEVKSVRIERLRDISIEDVKAEGVVLPSDMYHPDYEGEPPDPWDVFADLWNLIYEKRGFGWDTDPWVWVVEFGIIDREKKRLLAQSG